MCAAKKAETKNYRDEQRDDFVIQKTHTDDAAPRNRVKYFQNRKTEQAGIRVLRDPLHAARKTN